MKSFIAVTDADWLQTIRDGAATEVNFWQPKPTAVRQLPGTPWIFKVRRSNRIGGFGFFSYWTVMPLHIAWETFGPANGVQSYDAMANRIARLRRVENSDDQVGCVVLSDVTILDQGEYVAAPADWHPNIVRGAGYDLAVGEGERIWNQLRALTAASPVRSPLLAVAGGYAEAALVAARRGQGAFRLMVMDAYERRCAITGERTLPVLEAAHIRPFIEHEKHEVRNGLLMRSDLHRLYDRGLVTVEPDLTFRVSRSIERDYSNGKVYYALEGRKIASPVHDEARPAPEALAWHSRKVFRPN